MDTKMSGILETMSTKMPARKNEIKKRKMRIKIAHVLTKIF